MTSKASTQWNLTAMSARTGGGNPELLYELASADGSKYTDLSWWPSQYEALEQARRLLPSSGTLSLSEAQAAPLLAAVARAS